MARRTIIVRMPKKMIKVIEDMQGDLERQTGMRISKVQVQCRAADLLEKEMMKRKGKRRWL